MFDVGLSEILLILIIALVVLGPDKLPKLAADIGRWVGRARSMAKQLSVQLEQEVRMEEFARSQRQADVATPATPQTQAAPIDPTQTVHPAASEPSNNASASDAMAPGAPVKEKPAPAAAASPAPITPTPTTDGHS
jgi:sec-independent protein translocase protein TatB